MAIEITVKDVSIHVGDLVKINQSILEDNKERASSFEGIVISIKGRGVNKMFTVRRIGTDGIGIEKIFPATSPTISKVTLKKKGSVRRAKLYYLRKK